jgi:hypothetical protein
VVDPYVPVPIRELRACVATLVLGQEAHLDLLRIRAANELVCVCIVEFSPHEVRITGGDLYAVKRG